MSRSNEVLALLLVVAANALPATAVAQTIGDYSRAQRALIESTVARSARPPVDVPPMPLPALPTASSPSAMRSETPLPAVPEAPAPEIGVSGVIVASARRTAEVMVDGVPFLLEEGQRVPETAWTLVRIAQDRVVLSRPGAARGAKPTTRTFLLVDAEH